MKFTESFKLSCPSHIKWFQRKKLQPVGCGWRRTWSWSVRKCDRWEKARQPLFFCSLDDLCSFPNWGTKGEVGGQCRVSCPKKRRKKKSLPPTASPFPSPGGLLHFQPPGWLYCSVCVCVCMYLYMCVFIGELSPAFTERDETTTWAKNKRASFLTLLVIAPLQGDCSNT